MSQKVLRRGLCMVLLAVCIGCSNRVEQNARPASPGERFGSSAIDSLFIYVRSSPTEEAHFSLRRNAGKSSVVLERPGRKGRPRIVLDSIGPGRKTPEEVSTLLDSFDVWAMNAPDAPGASCRTVNGDRKCVIAHEDYSIVMLVAKGGNVRVQRYIGLEKSTGHPSARALGDFLLAWAKKRDAR